jgi:hypothetical protein
MMNIPVQELSRAAGADAASAQPLAGLSLARSAPAQPLVGLSLARSAPAQPLARVTNDRVTTAAQFAGAAGAALLANFLSAAAARAQTMETAAPLVEADQIVVGVGVGLALGAAAALIFMGASFLFHMAHSVDACLSRRAAGPTGNPEPRSETSDLALDSRSLAHASVGNDAQELANACAGAVRASGSPASGCAGAERASKDLARVAVRVAIRDRMSEAGRAALPR